jgi:hypothetical protein
MLDTLKAADFSELENKKFRVTLNETTSIELEVIAVQDLGTTEKQERFSIIFRGPNDIFLHQAIHRLEHEQLGTLELFLVPIGKADEGFEYEAAFNRLVKK